RMGAAVRSSPTVSCLPPQGEHFSHSSPAPGWGPSHWTQSSMTFLPHESFPQAVALRKLLQ
ncbi:unnamed protein product, partial [Bubo scandiacus]